MSILALKNRVLILYPRLLLALLSLVILSRAVCSSRYDQLNPREMDIWKSTSVQSVEDKRLQRIGFIKVFPDPLLSNLEEAKLLFGCIPRKVVSNVLLDYMDLSAMKSLKLVSKDTYSIMLYCQKRLIQKQKETVAIGLDNLTALDAVLFEKYSVPLIPIIIGKKPRRFYSFTTDFNFAEKELPNSSGINLASLVAVSKGSWYYTILESIKLTCIGEVKDSIPQQDDVFMNNLVTAEIVFTVITLFSIAIYVT